MTLPISTTSSETSSVMMVMTTRISTSVKALFFRFIAPPSMRLTPPKSGARLLVLDAPCAGARSALRVVAAGAPDVEAAGMDDGGPAGARAARAARRAAGLVVDAIVP